MNIVDGMTSLTWTQMSTFSPLPDSLALERLNNIASTNIPSPAISAPLDISQQSRSSSHSAASSSQSFCTCFTLSKLSTVFHHQSYQVGDFNALDLLMGFVHSSVFLFVIFGVIHPPCSRSLDIPFALLSCFLSTCFTHFERVSPYLSKINAIINSMTIYLITTQKDMFHRDQNNTYRKGT